MTIAGAIDKINDKLAGTDKYAPVTIEGALDKLAETIPEGGWGGGGGGLPEAKAEIEGDSVSVQARYSKGSAIVPEQTVTTNDGGEAFPTFAGFPSDGDTVFLVVDDVETETDVFYSDGVLVCEGAGYVFVFFNDDNGVDVCMFSYYNSLDEPHTVALYSGVPSYSWEPTKLWGIEGAGLYTVAIINDGVGNYRAIGDFETALSIASSREHIPVVAFLLTDLSDSTKYAFDRSQNSYMQPSIWRFGEPDAIYFVLSSTYQLKWTADGVTKEAVD